MNVKADTGCGSSDGHWGDMIGHWTHIGRPLKPGPEDIAVFERVATTAAGKAGGCFHALLLGVTPEIAGCQWPQGIRLIAIDSSVSMIDRLWPTPGAPPNSNVMCANWLTIPMAARSFDFVIGDGCHASLSFPGDVHAMLREVARVLRPQGTFVMRAFIRPDPPEKLECIARDLASGRIGSVHVLKWRLFAALCRDSESGTVLSDVWRVWDGMRALTAGFSAKPGWSTPELGTIEVYRGKGTRYYFTTLEEIGALVSQHFGTLDLFYGKHEFANCCPIMVATLSRNRRSSL
jgi:SAM-dependent methyltransferase